MMISGVSFAGGVLQSGPGVQAITASYNISLAENGFTYVSNATAAAVTLALPANAPNGFTATFVQASVAQDLIVQMPAGEHARIGAGGVTSAGGTLTFTGASGATCGASYTLRKVSGANATEWVLTGYGTYVTLPTAA